MSICADAHVNGILPNELRPASNPLNQKRPRQPTIPKEIPIGTDWEISKRKIITANKPTTSGDIVNYLVLLNKPCKRWTN